MSQTARCPQWAEQICQSCTISIGRGTAMDRQLAEREEYISITYRADIVGMNNRLRLGYPLQYPLRSWHRASHAASCGLPGLYVRSVPSDTSLAQLALCGELVIGDEAIDRSAAEADLGRDLGQAQESISKHKGHPWRKAGPSSLDRRQIGSQDWARGQTLAQRADDDATFRCENGLMNRALTRQRSCLSTTLC